MDSNKSISNEGYDEEESQKSDEITSKLELYNRLSAIYYLPNVNTNAINIQTLKNATSSNFFCLLQKHMLKNQKHSSCVSSLFNLPEIDMIVKFAVKDITGKDLFFDKAGCADKNWYSTFTKNFHKEIHRMIYHVETHKEAQLGYQAISQTAFVKATKSYGPFKAGKPEENKIVFKALKAKRKAIKDTKLKLQTSQKPFASYVKRMTKKIKKAVKQDFRRTNVAEKAFKETNNIALCVKDKILRKLAEEGESKELIDLKNETENAFQVNYDYLFKDKGIPSDLSYRSYFDKIIINTGQFEALKKLFDEAASPNQLASAFIQYFNTHRSNVKMLRFSSPSQKEIIISLCTHAKDQSLQFFTVIKNKIEANLQSHPRKQKVGFEAKDFITVNRLKTFLRHKLAGNPSKVSVENMIERIESHFTYAALHLYTCFAPTMVINEEIMQLATGRIPLADLGDVLTKIACEQIDLLKPENIRKHPIMIPTAALAMKITKANGAIPILSKRIESNLRCQPRWEKMVNMLYEGKIAVVLKMFALDLKIIRDLHVESSRLIFNTLIKLIYVLTYPSFKDILVYSNLSLFMTTVDFDTLTVACDQLSYHLDILMNAHLNDGQKSVIRKFIQNHTYSVEQQVGYGILHPMATQNAGAEPLCDYLGIPKSPNRTTVTTLFENFNC